uniref:AlNc14C48G3843 protein n=1 Tax=Albugo laibachii Nc14 TaxID=890382 RepID=F0WAY2_9STRA|nr:AlNc14C48G3843 [Albugo laibachii Nc14]CCA18423.1 AlNc14C50G3947 [Albugo laibachii Nc14]|eukprot:CCA18423.1 AlNc14C50G3947 [Albugo laibachii Nc14]
MHLYRYGTFLALHLLGRCIGATPDRKQDWTLRLRSSVPSRKKPDTSQKRPQNALAQKSVRTNAAIHDVPRQPSNEDLKIIANAESLAHDDIMHSGSPFSN